MSDVFCPEGFMPVEAAIVKAAHCWFSESLERAVPQLATSDSSIEGAVQALRRLRRAEWPWDAIEQTVTRLRNYLHQAKINAYYFTKDGRQVVAQNFWATSEADGVLETGRYWPNGDPNIIEHGEPSLVDEQPPTRFFFEQLELDALFVKKPKALPRSKIPELVDALRKLPHLTRPEQHEAIRGSFQDMIYHIDFSGR
jgi:hypothetical protein